MKKIVCTFLALCIVLCVVLIPSQRADATETIYASDIVSIAKELSGKYPYVWGGRSPSDGGFDCTGLVYYIYHTRLGYSMTLQQARSKSLLLAMGTKITNKSDLLPGDIVQYTIAHVGIYIGNNTVIHAGTTYGVSKVSINSSALTFSYGIRLPNVLQGDAPNSESVQTPQTPVINNGSWIVKVPSDYKLLCYDSETAQKSNGLYVRPHDSAYWIACTKAAALTDGTVRYYGSFNGGRNQYWFVYTNDMELTGEIETETEQPVYHVSFNPNGGWVETTSVEVKNGCRYGALPIPKREGYAFQGWATDPNGGNLITEDTYFYGDSDLTLYARWGEDWGSWSEWQNEPVYESSTRQVETRLVPVSDGHTEYRYGRYIDSTGRHVVWCRTYLNKLFGSGSLQYSNWSANRYSANGKYWTCGNCTGSHIGVDHITGDGYDCWAEYILPDGSYYWEESRWVQGETITQYRYRDKIEAEI